MKKYNLTILLCCSGLTNQQTQITYVMADDYYAEDNRYVFVNEHEEHIASYPVAHTIIRSIEGPNT